jgi:hypothetical protein
VSHIRLILITLAVCTVTGIATAQTDEIQVYDASHADTGVVNLTWHNNFTPIGNPTPAFPGSVVADKSFNGVTEWAYGVTAWFEQGLYLPLYSIDKTIGGTIDGFKIRELFTVPHAADRTFVYGVNFEFSFNSKHWDASRHTAEIRPIVGWHLKPWDIIVNPILDSSYDGVKNLDFAPETRVAYNINETWAAAAEEYDDFGPFQQFHAASERAHQLYAVVDRGGRAFDIEFGIGFGLTASSDRLTLKLLVAKDLGHLGRTQ